jgi:hypothetical protein
LVVALSALQLVGFGQNFSSVGSSARCFFGQVRCPRSHFACVTLAGFGCTRLLSFRAAAPEPVTSDRSSGKVARRAHAPWLRFSASSPRLHPRWLPSRLTSRSSRPRVVASATCFALRLHASAAPPRVGLTQALCTVLQCAHVVHGHCNIPCHQTLPQLSTARFCQFHVRAARLPARLRSV